MYGHRREEQALRGVACVSFFSYPVSLFDTQSAQFRHLWQADFLFCFHRTERTARMGN
jgi:hypothetical protein